MTIANKLNYLNQTKTAIKEAIINKGVLISDTDTFRSYADKINLISGQQSSNLSITNTIGLTLWLDSYYNTPHGYDPNIQNMYSIVGSYGYTNTNNDAGFNQICTGNAPYISGGGRLLEATGFYPDSINDEQTWELACAITNTSTLPNGIHIFFRKWNYWNTTGAYQLVFYDAYEPNPQSIVFQTRKGDNSSSIVVPNFWQINQILYITVTMNFSEGIYTLYSNGINITPEDSVMTPGGAGNLINFALNGCCNTSKTVIQNPNNSNYTSEGAFSGKFIKIYSFRRWDRILSNQEILNNYIYDKQRIESLPN